MSDLRSNSNGIRLRHCHECAFLVAFNGFNPAPNGFESETYWCRMRLKNIDDPEQIVCSEFCDAEKVGNTFLMKGDRRCSDCPNFDTEEKGAMVDGIWRSICVHECGVRRGKQIRFPHMLRACNEDLDDETETRSYRVTFVAYQTVEVEAEDEGEARRLAWDRCELSDAEIDDIEEVDRMCTGSCASVSLTDVQSLLESIGSGDVRDVDIGGTHSYIIIRFATAAPLRIKFRAMNLVSSRIDSPMSILYGGNCIVAWDVSKDRYASIGYNLAEYVSCDGIVDIVWCGKEATS